MYSTILCRLKIITIIIDLRYNDINKGYEEILLVNFKQEQKFWRKMRFLKKKTK